MELHKEIQGYITGKLYFICTLLSTFVLNSKYSEGIFPHAQSTGNHTNVERVVDIEFLFI